MGLTSSQNWGRLGKTTFRLSTFGSRWFVWYEFANFGWKEWSKGCETSRTGHAVMGRLSVTADAKTLSGGLLVFATRHRRDESHNFRVD